MLKRQLESIFHIAQAYFFIPIEPAEGSLIPLNKYLRFSSSWDRTRDCDNIDSSTGALICTMCNCWKDLNAAGIHAVYTTNIFRNVYIEATFFQNFNT